MNLTIQQVKSFLIGKTVSEVSVLEYMGTWIEEVKFTDGSILSLGGSCDYASVDGMTNADGNPIETIEC